MADFLTFSPAPDVQADNVQDYIKRASDPSESRYVSDVRLYLTDAGTVVSEGDESAAFLLVGKGCSIPLSLANDLGLANSLEAAPSDLSASGDLDTPGVRQKKTAAPSDALTSSSGDATLLEG